MKPREDVFYQVENNAKGTLKGVRAIETKY